MMHYKTFFISSCYVLALYALLIYINLVYVWEYLFHFFEEVDGRTVDYIIVGCGTAGSLIAHHLSLLENVSYIVLEAGGHGGPLLNPPALGPLLQHTLYDWKYTTIQQENACLGFKNGVCSWPAGKILGGSAKMNNMIHIRGYVDEIIPWFNETKYSRSEMKQILIELEATDLPYSTISYKTPLSNSFLKAGIEMGYPGIDSSSYSKIGFMEPAINQINGGRWSTSHTLLHHFSVANGLISTNSFVHKIIIKDNKAVGVVFEKFGKSMKVYAKKSIILSAGTIGSPKILLMSGVGPKDHLIKMNIPVYKNLPVGENLKDHIGTGLDLITINKPLTFNIEKFLNPVSAWNYFVHGSGPWTSSGCEGIALIDIDNDSKPDLQLMFLPLGLSTDYGVHLKNIIGVTDHVWENYFAKLFHQNAFSILPIVLHPKSKGRILLTSNNPYDLPAIDPNYFSDPEDLEVLLKGIDLIKRLINAQAMKEMSPILNEIPFPGCENYEFDSKDYWVCYIKHFSLTSYHPIGTCKMGASTDKSSVVGYDFSVKGLENLYVVDASIFPTMLSGNINTGVALIAKIFTKSLTNEDS